MQLSPKFISTVTSALGEAGIRWLEALPTIAARCADNWQLTNLKLHDNLSFNCIFFANRVQDGSLVVLKITPPHSDFIREIQALKIYNGEGAVKLLDYKEYDLEACVFLMEAVVPGTTLKSYFPEQDEKAVTVAANIMKKLHTAILPKDTVEFHRPEEWFQHLNAQPFDLPKNLVDRAIVLSSQLLSTQGKRVLLHGDLHHDNILSRGNQWVAIDPKGVMGEPAYEVGAFIRNPMPELLYRPRASDIILQRLKLFSTHLGIERQRLTEWSFVQAVLAACFACEDGDDGQPWISCAEFIEPFLN